MDVTSGRVTVRGKRFKEYSSEEQDEITSNYWDRLSEERGVSRELPRDGSPQDDYTEAMKETSLGLLSNSRKLKDASPYEQEIISRQLDEQKQSLYLFESLRTGHLDLPTFREEQAKLAIQRTKNRDAISSLGKLFTDEGSDEFFKRTQSFGEMATRLGIFDKKTILDFPGIVEGEIDREAVEAMPDTVFNTSLGGSRYPNYKDAMIQNPEKVRLKNAVSLTEEVRKTADNLGLKPEWVMDHVRHNNEEFEGEVSRDKLGNIHIKYDSLLKGEEYVGKAVRSSALPDSVKERYLKQLPDRMKRFREQITSRVKTDMPELASSMGIAPDEDAEKAYKKITSQLISTRGRQMGTVPGAMLSQAFTSAGAAMGPGAQPSPGSAEVIRKNIESAERGVRVAEQLTQLSYEFNKDKLQILGVDPSVIGVGLYSAGEAIAIGALTGPMMPVAGPARIAAAGPRVARFLNAANRLSRVSPVAGYFGVKTGQQTYEQALEMGFSEERATELGLRSGLIEGVTTAAMATLGLNTIENWASGGRTAALAALRGSGREAVRQEIRKGLAGYAKEFGKGFLSSAAAEQLEENLITTLDTLLVQTEMDPDITWDRFQQAVHDTSVATLFASGGPSAMMGFQNVAKEFIARADQQADKESDLNDAYQKTIDQRKTYEQTTDQLQDRADRIIDQNETSNEARPTMELYEEELRLKGILRNNVTDDKGRENAELAQEGLNRVRAEISRRKADPNFVEPSPATAESRPDSLPESESRQRAIAGIQQLDQDTRELLAIRLEALLEKNGSLKWDDIPVEIKNKIGTTEAAALIDRLKNNPQHVIDALNRKSPATAESPTATLPDGQTTSPKGKEEVSVTPEQQALLEERSQLEKQVAGLPKSPRRQQAEARLEDVVQELEESGYVDPEAQITPEDIQTELKETLKRSAPGTKVTEEQAEEAALMAEILGVSEKVVGVEQLEETGPAPAQPAAPAQPIVEPSGQLRLFQRAQEIRENLIEKARRYLKGAEATPSMRLLGEALEPLLLGLNDLDSRTNDLVQKAASLIAKVGNQTKKGNPKVLSRDFKKFLRDAWRANSPGVRRGWRNHVSGKARKSVVNQIVAEVAYAVANGSEATDWYSTKISNTIDIISRIHPEIKSEPESNFYFVTFLAIMSNGQNLDKNISDAIDLYEDFKKLGRVPIKTSYKGERKNQIESNLNTLKDFVNQFGWEKAKEILSTKRTVKEIKSEYGVELSGELSDELVTTSAVFGPKIGAFWANLNGIFDQLTMDLWFSRTADRLTGDLGLTSSSKVLKELQAYFDALGDKATPAMLKEFEIFKRGINQEWTDSIADILHKMPNTVEAFRADFKKFSGGKFKDKSPINESARNLDATLIQDKDAPESGRQRRWMRDIVREAQATLSDQGIDLTLADIQAVLWFYEKDLYTKFGATSEQGQQSDYEKAARKIIYPDVKTGNYQRRSTGTGGSPAAAKSRPKGSAGSVRSGQAQQELFQREESERPVKAAVVLDASGAILKLGKLSDASSILHELAHITRRFILSRELPPEARGGITDADIAAVEKAFGVQNGKWTVDQEEAFARAVERYFYDGVAPDRRLAGVFKKMAKWLRDIYTKLEGSSIDVEVTPEVKGVLDKLVTRRLDAIVPQKRVPLSRQTSLKHADTKKIRKKWGMDSYDKGDAITWEETRDEAAFRLEANDRVSRENDSAREEARKSGEPFAPRPLPFLTGTALMNDLETKVRPYDDVEFLLLAHHMQRTEESINRHRAELEKAMERGDEAAVQTNSSAIDTQFMELTNLIRMTDRAGSAQGRSLNLRKAVITRAFDIASLTRDLLATKRAKTRNMQAELTSEEKEVIKKNAKTILEKEANLLEVSQRVHKEVSEAEEQIFVDQAVKEAEKAQTKEVKAAERSRVKDAVSRVAQSARERIRAGGLDVAALRERLKGRSELSQRAEEDTDAAYLAAVESGDMETAQRMVDEAAKKAGYEPETYIHETTSQEPFTVFKVGGTEIQPGQELTMGDIWGDKKLSGHAIWFRPKEGRSLSAHRKGQKKDLAVKLKLRMPLMENREGITEYGGFNRDFPQVVQPSDVQRLQELGRDSVVYLNDKGEVAEILVFDPNNIKSADPITRDAEGNVIPLSRRFDPTTPDTLYQKAEETDPLDDLIAIGVEYIAEGVTNENDFVRLLTEEFGPEIGELGPDIFARSRRMFKDIEAREAVIREPAQILKGTNKDDYLNRKDVNEMARYFASEGLRGRDILDAVTDSLRELFPEITREEVAEAFTGYGKAKYPSEEEITVVLSELRNVERIQLQIEDVEAGRPAKRTGFQRGPDTETVRLLKKELEAAYKRLEEKGIKLRSAGGLKSPLDAVKARLRNAIEDLTHSMKTLQELPDNKRPVDYDEEAKRLRDERDALRKEYDKIFNDPAKTRKKQLQQAVKALDRRIDAEEKMARDGILKNPKKQKRVLNDPEIKARETRLQSLKDARQAAWEALNPKKSVEQVALERAKAEATKAIARYDEIVLTGDPKVGQKSRKYTPDQELESLWAMRDSMLGLVKQVRKSNRESRRKDPLLVAREKSIKALEKSIAEIEQRINSLNFTKKPRRQSLAVNDPEVVKMRQMRDALKKVERELEKASKVTKTPEQIRVERAVKNQERIKTLYEDKLRNRDFAKPARPSPITAKEYLIAKKEAAEAKAAWLQEKEKAAIEAAGAGAKAWRLGHGVLQLRKAAILGFDVGVIRRQAGVATNRLLINNPKKLLKFIASSYRSIRDTSLQKEFEIYEAIMNSPIAPLFEKYGGKFHGPFDEGFRNREDIQDPEFLNELAKMGWGKVGGVLAPVKAGAIALRQIESFQRTYINMVRYDLFAALLGYNGGPLNNLSEAEIKLAVDAASIATGRGAVKPGGMLDNATAFLNSTLFISFRYSTSRFQYAGLYPVWNPSAKGSGLNLGMRSKIAWEIYAKAALGQALYLTTLYFSYSSVFMARGDKDEAEDVSFGVDPRDPINFLRISVGDSKIDTSSGWGPFASFFARAVMRERFRDGVLEETTPEGRFRDVASFLKNRMNINASLLMNTLYIGQYFGGKEVTWESVLAETFANITVKDAWEIYQEHGWEGLMLFTQMMIGDGPSVGNPFENLDAGGTRRPSQLQDPPTPEWLKNEFKKIK